MKNKKRKKKNEPKNYTNLIVEIILVIIIIILFLHSCVFSKQNYEIVPTTGNVHIIEIKCDTSNVCKDPTGENKDPNKPENNGNNNGEFTVHDGQIKWDGVTEAKIFTNPMYKIEGVISPEDSNIYQFVVKNSTDYKLKYSLNFIESNPHNANIKYKLKKNSTYLIDHYVSASELLTSNINLAVNSSDTFYLEWKWISSSNDTKIGSLGNATYGLKIEIKAESTND